MGGPPVHQRIKRAATDNPSACGHKISSQLQYEISPAISRSKFTNEHDIYLRPPPKSPASRRASPQLRPNPLDRLYDVERPLRNRRLALAYCRRIVRLHGTRFPAWRSAVLVE